MSLKDGTPKTLMGAIENAQEVLRDARAKCLKAGIEPPSELFERVTYLEHIRDFIAQKVCTEMMEQPDEIAAALKSICTRMGLCEDR